MITNFSELSRGIRGHFDTSNPCPKLSGSRGVVCCTDQSGLGQAGSGTVVGREGKAKSKWEGGRSQLTEGRGQLMKLFEINREATQY